MSGRAGEKPGGLRAAYRAAQAHMVAYEVVPSAATREAVLAAARQIANALPAAGGAGPRSDSALSLGAARSGHAREGLDSTFDEPVWLETDPVAESPATPAGTGAASMRQSPQARDSLLDAVPGGDPEPASTFHHAPLEEPELSTDFVDLSEPFEPALASEDAPDRRAANEPEADLETEPLALDDLRQGPVDAPAPGSEVDLALPDLGSEGAAPTRDAPFESAPAAEHFVPPGLPSTSITPTVADIGLDFPSPAEAGAGMADVAAEAQGVAAEASETAPAGPREPTLGSVVPVAPIEGGAPAANQPSWGLRGAIAAGLAVLAGVGAWQMQGTRGTAPTTSTVALNDAAPRPAATPSQVALGAQAPAPAPAASGVTSSGVAAFASAPGPTGQIVVAAAPEATPRVASESGPAVALPGAGLAATGPAVHAPGPAPTPPAPAATPTPAPARAAPANAGDAHSVAKMAAPARTSETANDAPRTGSAAAAHSTADATQRPPVRAPGTSDLTAEEISRAADRARAARRALESETGDNAATGSAAPARAPAAPGTGETLARQMHHAADRGDVPALRHLLATPGATVDTPDAMGRTPLLQAVLSHRPGAVRVLVDAGADPTHADQSGLTPRAAAQQSSNAEIARLVGAGR